MLSQLNVKPRTTYLARIRNTPVRLMTRHQIEYINELEVHHGGHHGDDHHGEGHHGDDHHGEGHHGEEHHDDHNPDDHGSGSATT
jgi:molybdopterin-containing oxidoreductase family iron-sulfur binding subunit